MRAGVDIPEALLTFFEREIPFNAWLGMYVQQAGAGRAVLRLPFRPARLEDLWCDGEVHRSGNRVAVAQVVVRQAGDHVTARGRAVYNVVRADGS